MFWFTFLASFSFTLAIVFIAFLYGGQNRRSFGIIVGGIVIKNKFYKGNKKGFECEFRFNKFLQHHIGRDDYLISNALFKDGKQVMCEIDSILISRKGIFCIEIKSTKGLGRGSDQALHWRFYQTPNSRTKTNVENPVMQNKRHCDFLEKTLDFLYISENIVVFPDATDLTNIKSNKVYTADSFIRYFKSLKRNQLNKKEILQIVDKLSDNISIFHNLPMNKALTVEQISSFHLS